MCLYFLCFISLCVSYSLSLFLSFSLSLSLSLFLYTYIYMYTRISFSLFQFLFKSTRSEIRLKSRYRFFTGKRRQTRVLFEIIISLLYYFFFSSSFFFFIFIVVIIIIIFFFYFFFFFFFFFFKVENYFCFFLGSNRCFYSCEKLSFEIPGSVAFDFGVFYFGKVGQVPKVTILSHTLL